MKRYRIGAIFAFLFIIVFAGITRTASADNGVYKIDFGVNWGGATPTSVTGWSNFTLGINAATSVIPIVDSTGATTTVEMYWQDIPDCHATDPYSILGGNGGASSNTLGYPTSAAIDYIYDGLGGCSSPSSPSNFKSVLVFRGLNPSYTYNVKLFGSRSSGGNKTTVMTIGNASSTVMTDYNTSNVAQINNVVPSATSSISIGLSSGTAGQYYFVNVIELTANTPNIPPVVDAGSDVTITAPSGTVNLAGSAVDTDGTLNAYSFSLFSGNMRNLTMGGVIATTTNATSTTVTGLKPGKYVFRLSATDNNAITVTDDVTVTVLPAQLPTVRPAKKIAIVGSSTAQGYNSTPDGTFQNSWVRLFEQYMKLYNSSSTIVNLGLAGQRTWEAVPGGVNTANTITAALATNPDAVIINFTTNDANFNTPVETTTDNIRIMVNAAKAQGVPVWVTTTTGRNLTQPQQDLLIAYRQSIMAEYATSTPGTAGRAIDIWDPLANPNGSVNSTYDSGDGIHVGNLGHSVMFEDMVNSNIMSTLYAPVLSNIATSTDGDSFTVTWDTDQAANTQIQWGTTTAYTMSEVVDSNFTTSHEATLAALEYGTTYYYKITSTDYFGGFSSSTGSFATDSRLPVTAADEEEEADTRDYTRSVSRGGRKVVKVQQISNVSVPESSSENVIPTGDPVGGTTFTRDLELGLSGQDVLVLQRFLNAQGFTVASSGPGSAGNETTLFGALTRAALIKYQQAKGITPAAGYFGPITRKAAGF